MVSPFSMFRQMQSSSIRSHSEDTLRSSNPPWWRTLTCVVVVLDREGLIDDQSCICVMRNGAKQQQETTLRRTLGRQQPSAWRMDASFFLLVVCVCVCVCACSNACFCFPSFILWTAFEPGNAFWFDLVYQNHFSLPRLR